MGNWPVWLLLLLDDVVHLHMHLHPSGNTSPANSEAAADDDDGGHHHHLPRSLLRAAT
jgi:hypothetical protein